MPRRKTIVDDLFDILEGLTPFYVVLVILFWFSNKNLFWKMLVGGVVIFASLFIAIWLYKRSKIHKQSQWQTDKELERYLLGLEHWEFEKYIGELFVKLGYKIQVIGGSYDEGIDVIAEKDGVKHYIQCKHYSSSVGVEKIRDFYGAITAKYSNEKSFFITTGYFTEESERFAADKNIELINRPKLIRLIRQVENNKK
jgi:HJR/Mrr/RecB family endonuclease